MEIRAVGSRFVQQIGEAHPTSDAEFTRPSAEAAEGPATAAVALNVLAEIVRSETAR